MRRQPQGELGGIDDDPYESGAGVTGPGHVVLNPIDRYGAERFGRELAEAGGAGGILPDLPVQESAR